MKTGYKINNGHSSATGRLVSLENFSIIVSTSKNMNLLILESVLILRDRPTLNSQTSSIWLALFKFISPLSLTIDFMVHPILLFGLLTHPLVGLEMIYKLERSIVEPWLFFSSYLFCDLSQNYASRKVKQFLQIGCFKFSILYKAAVKIVLFLDASWVHSNHFLIIDEFRSCNLSVLASSSYWDIYFQRYFLDSSNSS